MKKIALFKKGYRYVLLLQYRDRLSYIVTTDDIKDIDDVSSYVIHTYKNGHGRILEDIYGSRFNDIADYAFGNGTNAIVIGSKVAIVFKNLVEDYEVINDELIITSNVNSMHDPEMEHIKILDITEDAISYHNNDKYIVLTNIPMELIKRY